jgi:hypothetical protein
MEEARISPGCDPRGAVAVRHPSPSLLELSVALTLMSAAPAAAADPRFSAPVQATTGQSPSALVSADFNSDTKPDLATTDYGGNSVSMLLGKGDGSFATRIVYRTTRWPWDLVAADLNADGRPDLVTVSGEGRGRLVVFLNDGAGRFHRAQSARLTAAAVAAGDVNGDGVVDLVAATEARRDFAVLLGNGGGGFAPPRRSAGDRDGSNDLELGDMNGDGRLDAVLVTGRDKLAVRLGNGDGTFGPERATPADDEGENMLDVTLADLNRDGRLDAATASYYGAVGVFPGRGDGAFGARRNYSTIGKTDSVTVADYDADGTLDLAVSGADYIPFVRRGRGDGTFGKAQYLEWVIADYGVTADFNQDGRADLAFVKSEQTSASVFLNWTGLAAPPCVVLDLSTFGLRKAKSYLGFAGCRLGHVTRRYSRRVRRNRVISQSPPVSTVLPSGSAVDLVLSRGRRGAH